MLAEQISPKILQQRQAAQWKRDSRAKVSVRCVLESAFPDRWKGRNLKGVVLPVLWIDDCE
ncbi:MAG: hypothetical protein ABGZ24_30615, partial [Fuerstiella sp.]